jgi:hypothetical protein
MSTPAGLLGVVALLACIESGYVQQAGNSEGEREAEGTEANIFLPVPDEDEQQAAKKTIRVLFKREFADAKTSDAQISLAKRLIVVSAETRDDAAGAFVLLSEARTLAIEAGDLSTALEAVRARQQFFAVDALTETSETLGALSGSAPGEVCRYVRIPIAMAVQSDRFDVAEQLIAVGTRAANKARNRLIAEELRTVSLEVARVKEQAEEYEQAQKRLANAARDQAANLTVARYLALRKRDWQAAAERLRVMPADAISGLIERQIAAPEETESRLALGDAWWEYADGQTGAYESQARQVAGEWYGLVENSLSGLTAIRVKQRLKQAGPPLGDGGVPPNAVRAGSFAAWVTPLPQQKTTGKQGADPDQGPGDAPRPGQAYLITIQINVPEGMERYPLRDLSGEVVGSDGYRQKLPDRAFVLTEEGTLSRPSQPSVRVTHAGVVQIAIRVPGAHALVQDTIEISSKMLNEQQTLKLVFGSKK